MLSFRDRANRMCQGFSRREWLRVGGLSSLGLSLAGLLSAQSAPAAARRTSPLVDGLSGAMFGRARNVIFLWLQGGPPQHETFDPKPEAPLEIRGPFRPIQTNVPGIDFCELLPRTAQRADRLAVIRSLATDDNNHDVSGYWVLTGYPYGPGSAREIKPTDWPWMGSIIKRQLPSERLPALTSVWLPDMMRLNDNVTPAGQTGGFLGSLWDPERFVGDPAAESYRIEGLALPIDLSPDRMHDRSVLLGELDQRLRQFENRPGTSDWERLSRFAMDLVTSGQAKAAFDLSRESESVRSRYGRHTWGQSCLLARRLIEAGVRLVHVNWPREPGDNAVDNPMWDTHAQNADRLQDVLCPLFDVTFAALLDDLEDRGLLSETLVVAIGEFGRTPKINAQGGRDHWGSVFCGTLAGAGISGGQVFGASDRNGAYPAVDPIRPHDLTATIFHLLGMQHDGVFPDRTNRPQPLTKGEPLYRLLGAQPATSERRESDGDERLVPAFDDTLVVNTDFRASNLHAIAPASRTKGWRADPLTTETAAGLLVRHVAGAQPHVRMGVPDSLNGSDVLKLNSGTGCLLAQEIRNARGGHYVFSARISGDGSSPELFRRCFAEAFGCRLLLFRYRNPQKSPREVEELASQEFQPVWSSVAEPVRFTVSRFLGSTIPGTNFSIGNGLGIAIVMDVTSPVSFRKGEFVAIRVHDIALEFTARMRDDTVTV